jgi:hypothetical protein
MNARSCIPLVLALVGTSVGACGEAPKQASRYSLSFTAVDDRGDGLEGVPMQIGETAIGATAANGVLHAEVNAKDGDRYPLIAPCPDGYDPFEVPSEVVFLDTRGLGGEKNASLEIRIVCKRQTRVAAVLVHAGGHEGMPILVDGVPKGITGPGGISHLRIEGSSNSQFEVSLDTSGEPNLVPKNPRHEVQLGGEDGLFVFEPALSEAEPEPAAKPKRRRHRGGASSRSEPAKPKRPVKID